jgi:hypothetical protein
MGPEGDTAELPSGFFPLPAYDSGWTSYNYDGGSSTLNHNLGTTDVSIYLRVRTASGVELIGDRNGYWNYLTANTIWGKVTGDASYQFRIMM